MKRSFSLILGLAFVVALMAGCEPEKFYKVVGSTQGTTYEVNYSGRKDYSKEIDSILKDIDLTFSTYNPNSLISKVNRNEPVELNKHFITVFNKAMEISEASNGLFDITVGPLVKIYGFGTNQVQEDVTQEKIDSLLKFVGYKKVRIEDNKLVKDNPNIQLDMNAIAQGYTVDQIAKFLDRHGVKNYYVYVGGEVIVKGHDEFGEPWRIGIEKPIENTTITENPLELVIEIKDEKKAVATSGNYRRFYVKDGVKYTHTINPITGQVVRDSLLSVSILADDCTTADGYATAALVSGFKKGVELVNKIDDIEGFFIYVDKNNNYKFYFTPGFKKYITE